MSNNKCKNDNGNGKCNDVQGLLTSIWGPPTWESIHCITFKYPNNPTPEQKKYYKQYFEILGYVLPCDTCQVSYRDHIVNGETELNDKVFENRTSLTYWAYLMHCTVLKRIGINYDISYEDHCKRYESFIAGCELPLERKAIAYKNAYNKEAPMLKYLYAVCFVQYANERGINDFLNSINTITKLDKQSDEWIKRNEESWNIIKNMRIKAISCIELDGKYKGLPTLNELNLMKLMSTSMTDKIIKQCIKQLGFKIPNIL